MSTRFMRVPRILALCMLGLGAASCDLQSINSSSNDDVLFSTDDGTVDVTGNPKFAAARSIIIPNCTSCHRAFKSYSETDWIANGYVVAQSASTSYLYSKLRGSGVGGDENMPQGGSLSAGDLSTIRDWINGIGVTGGAPGGGTTGSAGGGTGGPTAAQRLSAATAVLQNRCASCHNVTRTATSTAYSGATVPAFTTFATDNDFVVGGMIDPNNPANSWIYRALIGYGNIGVMPQGGPAIPAADASKISDWITKIGQP